MRTPFEAAVQGPPAQYVIDGLVYEVAGPWTLLATLLQTGDWELPLLLQLTHPDDREVLEDRIVGDSDPLGMDVVERVAWALVRAATGLDWWAAARLYGWAASHWVEFDGALMRDGVDWLAMLATAPGRAAGVVYARLVDGAGERERAEFDARVFLPPAGLATDSLPEWVEQEESDAFMSALGAHQARQADR